jgi:hypothetical protein
MTTHSPILDYAGPASRSALRLAAKSEMHIDDQPRRLIVREHLAGRGQAIVALAIAALSMIVMLSVQADLLHKWRRNVEMIAIFAGFEVAELFVGAMVINQTWRRTVLKVTPDEVSLTFAAPFKPATVMHWTVEQVAEVHIIDSDLSGGVVAPELELRMWSGPAVRLFTGHRHSELARLVTLIHAIQPPLPQAAGDGVPQP